MKTKANPVCRVCGTTLSEDNWYRSFQKGQHYICKNCQKSQLQQWRRINPEKHRAQWIRANRKRQPQSINENKKGTAICRKCGVMLSDENWYPSQQKYGNYICKSCHNKQTQQWEKTNPDKAKARFMRAIRKRGVRPMSENKECASFLGVHIAEGALKHAFENVKPMPMNNPGFDLVCNKGKIDVKSSCLGHYVVGGIEYSHWIFSIGHNQIADYFLCIAFNNREDLNPMYMWLLPGGEFNHLTGVSISPSTIHKWSEYELDISKVAMCCNAMRSEPEAEPEASI